MLTTAEAATRLGLKSHRVVVQYIKRGLLTAERRIERGLPVYYITEDELTRYERDRQQRPGPHPQLPAR